MKNLITATNIKYPDSFYAKLLEAHTGLSDDESVALNSRLILLLANHIGEEHILLEALVAASLSNSTIQK